MTSTLPSRELLNELKLAKGKNSLVFAITEDRDGLNRLLNSNNFDVRSVDLRDNGNLLQMLVEWEDTPDNTVYLIYGISSQFPAVLGYLNLHRDLLYQIKRPVLMAVSEYEIREIQKHAPDLYRYRSRTYNLKAERDFGNIQIFSEPTSIYYNLPIFEEKIDADTIGERIKLDEYLLGTVNEDHKRADLYMELAISYYKLGDFYKGDNYSRRSMNIRKELEDDKGIRLNYQRLIGVFLLKRQFDRVIELSNLLIKLDPRSASTYAFCGIAYFGLGQFETALKCYKKAIELNPKDAVAWLGKGLALEGLSRWEDALGSFEKTIELDPKNANAWYSKGAALDNLGKTEDSIQAYERAYELGVKYATLFIALARIYRKLSRESDRNEVCKKARDFFKTKSEYSRACFEAVCGSPDAALALLRTALEKKEQTADWARRDPDFEPIRDDPRFAALLDEFSPGAEKGP